MPMARPHVPTVCNSMWALTDFTEDNGATRIIPGSHLADTAPEYGRHYDSIPAEMPRGSVLVWHGSLWHGGGANRTDQRRVGVAMNYCAGWVRQQENQQLGIPLEAVARMPERLQQLCGFGIYKGFIGHIDKQTPARALLGAERPSRIVWDAVG
jgi:ectoine hydroxylase-related dioxygenase (phytanoyl-CoA dioxygenase family)